MDEGHPAIGGKRKEVAVIPNSTTAHATVELPRQDLLTLAARLRPAAISSALTERAPRRIGPQLIVSGLLDVMLAGPDLRPRARIWTLSL